MPRIRFVSLTRTCVSIQGPFEELLASLRVSATENTTISPKALKDKVLLPVHELQIPNILANFPDADILPEEFGVVAPAQASIRFVRCLFRHSN